MKRTCLRIITITNENSKHGVPYDIKNKLFTDETPMLLLNTNTHEDIQGVPSDL
jgi:hypothetical protein